MLGLGRCRLSADPCLDIGQGNRVFDTLYDSELPKLPSHGHCGPWWRAVTERAASAPADIVPGLLTSTLKAADVGVSMGTGASSLFGVWPAASRHFTEKVKWRQSYRHPQDVTKFGSSLPELPKLIAGLHGNDLLIAIEYPPPAADRALAIGIAGRGFDGDLTSDSTRLDGYVLSTDLAPTILRRLGVAVPAQMSGQPIRSEGSVDPGAVVKLGDRLASISGRRFPVIGGSLLVWLVAFGLAMAATRGRVARQGVRLAGLSVVYLPSMLLLGAALEPSQGAELLLVTLGAPLLGCLTLAALGGYRALAIASGLTVLVYAVDVIAGSPLTSLSLLGPNPGLGVRFYGIGNELEALLAVLVVAGTGAGLTGFAPRLSARGCVAASPRHRPRLRPRLRRRPLRRRCRRGDRLAGGGGRGGRHRGGTPSSCRTLLRGAVRGAGTACPPST